MNQLAIVNCFHSKWKKKKKVCSHLQGNNQSLASKKGENQNALCNVNIHNDLKLLLNLFCEF